MNRRTSIKYSIMGVAGLSSINRLERNPLFSSGVISHSACRWCYADIPLELFAEQAKDVGVKSIELLNPEEWDTVINKGLTCAISNGSPLGITKGFNDPQYHDQLKSDFFELIPKAASKGIKQIICFSGNRHGISNEEGLEQCAIGLEPIVKLAQQYDIKIVMELLNSKVDHKDYQCDNTAWGVSLVEKLGLEHFSLLYDIYHMQIMEGDVIRTIRDNIDYISHFHTGGVPGRNEIDLPQELNYTAIMKAIVGTGFTGYVAQEFIPKREDKLLSLHKAIQICNV